MRSIQAELRLGLLQVQLAAIPWSLLSHELSTGGYHPSAPSPFSDPYAVQALTLPLLLGMQWFLTSLLVFSQCAMKKIPVSFGPLCQSLGTQLGLSILLLFVVPDYFVFKTRGFDAMGSLLPITAPLCLLGIAVGGSRVLAVQTGLRRFDAFKVFAISFFIASAPILVVVR